MGLWRSGRKGKASIEIRWKGKQSRAYRRIVYEGEKLVFLLIFF